MTKAELKEICGFFSSVDWCIIGAIVAILTLGIYACHREESTRLPQAYAAWVKQTGNPKQLSYDEWRMLLDATRHTDGMFIVIPMME